MKPKKIALTLLGAVIGTLFVGCSTVSTNAKQGTVCPDCKVMVVKSQRMTEPYGQQIDSEGHRCPGCQGTLTTLLKEGTLQHQCSICASSPYTCGLGHRISD